MNAINQFIAGLNGNQKRLLMVTVVIVIAALFDRLLIAPTMSRLSSIEEDIAKEEATIKQDMRFLGYRDRIVKESDEVQPFLANDILSDNEMIASFLNKIQMLATTSKITLVKINPAPAEQDADYWKYQADLECSGQLADVISFMHSINADAELMKVDKFSFSGKKSDTNEIKATMTVEKIVVPQKAMPPKAQDANAPANPPAAV